MFANNCMGCTDQYKDTVSLWLFKCFNVIVTQTAIENYSSIAL